jgi:dienelactone hydrolase
MPTQTPSPTHRLAQRLRRQRKIVAAGPRLYAAFVLAVLALLAVFAQPAVKAHLQAVAVLDLVAGKPVPAALHWLVGEPVTTTDLTLPLPSGPVRARLYTPTNHPNAPGFIVFHGVHYLGMDEPRLIAFAAAMSSCGLRVLTPELPDIKDYHVGPNTVRVIGDTARWLDAQTGGPVGVMGLSFSGGLSLLAASDPEYRPAFRFVFAVGSQGSMARVFHYYITNTDIRPDGTTEHLPAHEYGPLVLEYEYLDDFVPPADLAPIRAVLRAHLYEDKPAETAALTHLTPAQTLEALHLMDATSPETRALLAHAVAAHTADLAGLSPGPHLKTLTVPVYLLHGEADNIIPSAETLWMASQLQDQTLKAALVSPVLSHLDFGESKPTMLDNWRLIHFFALVLHAAEQR